MREKKRKVGRPRLPKSESRSVVSLRLKPGERKDYENCAKRVRENLSDWIRESLSRAAKECSFRDGN